MRINKEKLTVGIHSEPNHADDVLCVALLVREYGEGNVEVKRTRDLEILKTCDYILDVGGKDEIIKDDNGNIVQVWLDHHQIGSEYEENGVKKAACSKLADFLYAEKEPFFLKELHYLLLDPVAISDNGQDLSIGQNYLNFVGMTVEQDWTHEVNEKESFECFNTTRKMVNIVLDRVIERVNSNEFGKSYVENALSKAVETNKEYIILDKYIPRFVWNDMILRYNMQNEKKIKSVIFKSTHETWDAVMIHKDRNTFKCICTFPEKWLGLRDNELETVSGIRGAIFCHTAGFFFEGSIKESVIRAVEIALN